jgi:hypothetical protein
MIVIVDDYHTILGISSFKHDILGIYLEYTWDIHMLYIPSIYQVYIFWEISVQVTLLFRHGILQVYDWYITCLNSNVTGSRT